MREVILHLLGGAVRLVDDLIGLPLRARRAGGFRALIRGDDLRRRHRQIRHLLRRQLPGYALRQYAHTVNLYGHGLVLIPGQNTDGMVRIIDKLIIRSRPGYRRIHARRYIGRCKGMGAAIRGRQSGTEHRIVQGRGNLADTAAGLGHHLALVIRRRTAVAFFFCTLSHRLIERELLTRLQHRTVDGSRRQLDVVVPHRRARRLRGEAADDAVLVLDGGIGTGHALTDGIDHGIVAMLGNRIQHLLGRCVRIYGIAGHGAAKYKLSGICIIFCDITILRVHLPHSGQLLHVIADGRAEIRDRQNIIRCSCSRTALRFAGALCFRRSLAVFLRR